MRRIRIKRIVMLTCCLTGVLHFAGARADTPSLKLEACTSFRLLVGDSPLIGKNLDWSIEDGILSMNPRGIWKQALVEPACQPAEWVSRYASVTFNQFGREFPLGGMNEAGLVVEELSYWPSRYPPLDERPCINELQWVQYQLDIHASVAEVIEHISDVQVSPMLGGLHYFVVDASGEAAVIEFLDGELTIHRGSELPVPVLANNTYSNSLRYLSSYAGFGGTRTVSDGPESPERFVRAATMLKEFDDGKLSTAPVAYAFQVLKAVAQDDTQWSIVYDVGSRTVHFITASVPIVRRISLGDMDLDYGGGAIALDLSDHYEGDVSEKLSSWTSEDQDRLISSVLEKIADEGMIDDLEHQRIREGVVRLGITVPPGAKTDLFENPPRDKAEIFAQGIVSTKDKEHSNLSISPDGTRIYWSIWEMPDNENNEIKIVNMTMANGKWGVRRTARFNSGSGSFHSCFWGDDKIIFRSKDVLDDFWMVKKRNGQWSEPALMGFDEFSKETKAPYSVSGSGNIYYCSKLEGVAYETGIYVSFYENERHTAPLLLPEHINTEHLDWTPYVPPDESFLLFSSNRPGSIGSTDIYVAFKNSDGTWSDPVNLGEKVNTELEERFPSLTSDGKILFFLRDYDREHQDFYWIDAGFIEELRG